MTRGIAVIADIHGNMPALEAVLSDIAARGVDRTGIINLGDHVSGPLWPRDTVALLMRASWTQIAGNCDRVVASKDRSELGPSDRFAFDQIDDGHRAWLRSLPPTAVAVEELFAVHGTPSDDMQYLLETPMAGKTGLASDAEIRARLGDSEAPVILCGHSHVPRSVRVGGSLIVNPGSVGLQAFEGDEPEPHVIETGSPDARYAILTRVGGEWQAELVAVPYDHVRAAAQATRNGRDDWARALRTGTVR